MKKLLKCGVLFTGKEVIKNGAVVIDGETIVDVGTLDQITVPEDCEVLDLQDQFVMAGLIDAHTHFTVSAQNPGYVAGQKDPNEKKVLRAARNMRIDLKTGVTTIRCLGEQDFLDVIMKEAIESGMIPGPRALISGYGLKPSFGHGVMAAPFDGCDEVVKAVRTNIQAGADQIKLFVTGNEEDFSTFKFGAGRAIEKYDMHSMFTPEEIQAAIDIAHGAGRKVAAHCYGGLGARLLIEAGLDTLEHGIYLEQEEIDMMVEAGTWLTLTMNAYFNDERLANRGTPDQVKGFVKYRSDIQKNLQNAVSSGVKFMVGTDGQHGALISELELIVDLLGVSNELALKAATCNAAEACGVADKIGTIEAGKLADIISVQGNPLNDISDMHKVNVILKGGCRVDTLSDL